jgi:arsenate reductase (thioredoxin)
MNKIKVLFVCIHNSARSQMAEAFLNSLAGDRFEAESAGIEPGKLNPIVVDAMKEIGLDISKNKTKDVFEFYKLGKTYKYVITVCDKNAAEKCPVFLGVAERIHWSFPDPSALKGNYEEKLEGTRKIREQIKHRIEAWTRNLEIEEKESLEG